MEGKLSILSGVAKTFHVFVLSESSVVSVLYLLSVVSDDHPSRGHMDHFGSQRVPH